MPLPTGPIHVSARAAPKPAAVTADLPPLPAKGAPQQLVTAIQRELAARGYARGPADGKLSDETRKAIAAFEKEHGLPVTGAPSDELLRRILLGEAVAPAASTGSVASSGRRAEAGPAGKRRCDGETSATDPRRSRLRAGAGRRHHGRRDPARRQRLSARPKDRAERTHHAGAVAGDQTRDRDATSRARLSALEGAALQMRIKSELWVKAYLRGCQGQGRCRRGRAPRRRERRRDLYLHQSARRNRDALRSGPAGLEGGDTERRWVRCFAAGVITEEEAASYLARQVNFDADIWIVEIEDRAGRHFLGDAVAEE